MAKRWQYTKVVCPYYRDETAGEIRCCGIREDCVTHVAFGDRAQKMKYRTQICVSDHVNCPIKKMLDKIHDA